MIYLDHCATTPLCSQALAAMTHAAQTWPGNPSSIHSAGRQARHQLEEARQEFARRLGCEAGQVVFTASGSEANNLALKGTVLARKGQPVHLIVSATEHDSILQTARALATSWPGVTLSEIRPGPQGVLDPQQVARAIGPDTCLISIQHVNHESGVIQPVQAIARAARSRGVCVHTDAVQSAGKLALNIEELGVDLLTLSAHKFNGPRGVGVLAGRGCSALRPLIHGGHQEGGRRAGTENLPAITGAMAALEQAELNRPARQKHLRCLEQIFVETLRRSQLCIEVNGEGADKVPGVLSLSVRGVAHDDLVVAMDLSGVAISAGAACSSGVIEDSPVLVAMGLEPWRIRSAVRISFGHTNTEDETRHAAQAMIKACESLIGATLPEEGYRS